MTETFDIPTPESFCPYCGEKFDSVWRVGKKFKGFGLKQLRDRTFSICVYCGEILQYDENYLPVKVNKEDLEEMRRDSKESYVRLMTAQKYVKSRNT